VLITSNAHNGYDNVGLLEIATEKDNMAHQRQMGNHLREVFSRWKASHLGSKY